MLALMQQSPLILVDLSIGGIILGIPLAVGGYLIAFRSDLPVPQKCLAGRCRPLLAIRPQAPMPINRLSSSIAVSIESAIARFRLIES
jgi:hypothetical protein